MTESRYFAASDDRADHYRRVGSGPLERRQYSMDPLFMIWNPILPGHLKRWGIELVPLPCINDGGLLCLVV
jgi:hypothetical protein